MKQIILHVQVLAVAWAVGALNSIHAADSADNETNKTETAFIEPILIEETMPNDPGELSLRLTTDYRRNGGGAVGTLPDLQVAEIQGDWGSPNHTTLGPGIKYYLSDKFTAGLAVPVGLNGNTERWGIVTQFQMEF
jgi:hypothetical protein